MKVPAIAWFALGVAIFAFLLAVIPFATWGSGLFILAGLILSIIALAKVKTARGFTITALILSVIAIPATIVMTIVSIALLASAGGTSLDRLLVEQQITAGIMEQLDIEATVVCPEIMTGTMGTSFECVATDFNGDQVIVDVTIEDDQGNVTWEIRE
jgi:hypothetical protein